MPEVIAVDPAGRFNPAAVSSVIENLIAQNYGGADWVRQGPNFIQNKVTKEVRNLNQEAMAILEAAPARQDAVATVAHEDGTRETIWVDQSAVQAAGGNLQVLKANLQNTLGGGVVPAVAGLPKWIWFAGAAGLGYFLWQSNRRPAHGR